MMSGCALRSHVQMFQIAILTELLIDDFSLYSPPPPAETCVRRYFSTSMISRNLMPFIYGANPVKVKL